MTTTSTNNIYLMMLVIILAVSACQSRADKSNPNQTTTTPMATPGKVYLSTKTLAEAYLMALVAGDKQEASSLLTLGAVCTPGNFTENIERHLDRFSASQVRHIRIEVEAGSPTMHGQHSEVAHITFEYSRGDSAGWRLVKIWVTTIPKSVPKHRGICDVSRFDEINVPIEESR